MTEKITEWQVGNYGLATVRGPFREGKDGRYKNFTIDSGVGVAHFSARRIRELIVVLNEALDMLEESQ